MVLSPLEQYALEKVLASAGAACPAVDPASIQVLGRERTRAGFYILARSHGGFGRVEPHRELCLAFTHHALKGGGYFVCWFEDDSTLCLEAVARQQDWPADISPLEILCRS